MKYKVHVIPHFHWDREWYFTQEESDLLLLHNMEEIMSRLETDEQYPYYILDGQMSIMEEYIEFAPQNLERFKRLVAQGKLIVGPWYSQTDEMVVGGESIVRNLLYGHALAEQYGEVMKIGYLPDSFGQSAQLPHILNGFGIERAIFWRGVSERFGTNKTEFHWESSDGSNVLTLLLPLGYAIGKYLPEDPAQLAERMSKYMPVLEKGATSKHLVLPHGHDQMPLQKNIHEVIEQLEKLYPDNEFSLTNYDKYFEELEAENNELDTIHGEFLDGKYMRVHRSIYGSRMDIKNMNTTFEQLMANTVEPLAAMYYLLSGVHYPKYIESIWKPVLKSHAHDSIACCCSDPVHHLIKERFYKSLVQAEELKNYTVRQIADHIMVDGEIIVAYNTLTQKRNGTFEIEVVTKKPFFKLLKDNQEVEYQIVEKTIYDAGLVDRQLVHYGDYRPFHLFKLIVNDQLPAFGYQTYQLVETEDAPMLKKQETDRIVTDFYTITVEKNGQLTILDKQSQEKYEGVFKIDSQSDVGDSYDFSPLAEDIIFTTDDVNANTVIVEHQYGFEIDIAYQLPLPKTIADRVNQLATTEISISQSIKVSKQTREIQTSIVIENTAENHRMRLHIPMGIPVKTVTADNQFGTITRASRDEALDIWEKENWSERPDAIYPFLNFLQIQEGTRACQVMTKTSREYEIVGESLDVLAITLFRSIGLLGEKDLTRRPGRPSGIALPIPDSQMQGRIVTELAVNFEQQQSLFALAEMTKRYTTTVAYYNRNGYNAMKLNRLNITLPSTLSLIETEANTSEVLSIIKKAEKTNDIIVRYTNYKPKQSFALKLNKQYIKTITEARLDETRVGECIDPMQIETSKSSITLCLEKK